MTVVYWASRDSLTAWRDEDRGMAHAAIVQNEASEREARRALAAYMIKEAQSLMDSYGPEAFYDVHRLTAASVGLLKRAGQMIAAAAEVIEAEQKWDTEKTWQAVNFDVDGIRFQLTRIKKEDK